MIIRRSSEADFTFTADEYSEEMRVLRFSGTEGVSTPFRYDIKLAISDTELDFADIIGKGACLCINGETGERYVRGIISKITQSGVGDNFTVYHVELVPLIWLLKHRHGCRIFQNMTFEAIITQIFQDAGISSDSYRFTPFNGTHNTHEYCVQYRESEFNFISRLMEEEGMFYYFEHTEDMHVMVIGDNSSVHTTIESPTVIFNSASSMVPEEEYVYEFRYIQQIRPSATSLRDFNYERPTLGTMHVMSLAGEDGSLPEEENLEVYDYPGDYFNPDFGSEISQWRLEALRYNSQMGVGESVCRRFLPGSRFTLNQYGRPNLNQEYLITHLKNFGTQPLGEDVGGEGIQYNNEFECIAYAVPFRPPRKTPKPVVEGIQTAYVVGPGSDPIHFDEMGRVKVQFHWDREGRNDENSSCWVRVSDGYAGQNHGIQFPPLVGDEVIVSFLEGDPDRPLITGRVYNGTNLPYLDPQKSIQNIMFTPYDHTLLFDDKRQAILLRTGKGQQLRLRDDPADSSDDEKGYGNYATIMTMDGHNMTMTYGTENKHIVLKSVSGHTVKLDDMGGNISITSAGGHNITLDDANKMIKIVSTDGHSITISDTFATIILSSSSEDQGIMVTDGGTVEILNNAGDIEIISSAKIKLDASAIDIKSSGDINIEAGGKINIKAGTDIKEEAGTNVDINGNAKVSIKSAIVDIKGSGKVGIQGTLTEVKGTPIKLN
jgi:type VI secretion system secreted protein VgrG